MKYRIGVRKKSYRGRNALLVTCSIVTAAAIGFLGTGQSVLARLSYRHLPWPWSESHATYYGGTDIDGANPSQGNDRTSKGRKSKAANARKTSIKSLSGASSDLLGSGTWSFLPGSVQAADGSLTILPTAFVIVEQDGSGGQANPPVNLYGTRLDVSGDFELAFDLNGAVDTAVGLQLYGSAPVIADEFRVERQSVRVSLKGSTMTVSVWGGSSQTPTMSAFSVAAADDYQLKVIRSDGELGFILNGETLGSVHEAGIFSGGRLWFGMDAVGGNGWKLAGLAVVGKALAHDTTADAAIPRDPAGLQALADKKRPGLLIGAAMALGPLAADDQYRKVALGNFGAMTTENALKWQFVHPAKDVYDFGETDAMFDIAARSGLAVHAHTLVFGEANPAWVQALAPSERQAVMLQHIKAVAGHFKGKVTSWDVINEPFDDEEWSSFRQHVWYQAMGENYIPLALQAAHQADPGAQLFMNEYGIEEDGERWDAMLALVTKLKQQGVPLDGVGFQSHIYASTDKINPTILRKHIQQLAAIGLKARISEVDVYSEDGQQNQATQYQQVLGACLSEPNCVSYTTWGVSDRYDWFKDDGTVEQGEDFLWNRNMQPTPAVAALLQLLQ